MEFNEKLQQLRKQKGLTQEELSEKLYVSRTAISKWESGKGYPSIDSLKAIAKFFSITVDELLSGEELLNIAKEEQREKEKNVRSQVYGLLDLSNAMLLFIPFFAERADGTIKEVSLLGMIDTQPYLKILYFIVVFSTISFGVLMLALQNCRNVFWINNNDKISCLLSVLLTIAFIISMQPYAAIFAFTLLIIKATVLIKTK